MALHAHDPDIDGMTEEFSDSTLREELTEALRENARLRAEADRPPVADDLLILFGRIAAVILFVILLVAAALIAFRPEYDLDPLTTLLNTQLSIIIGAVLGYAAHPTEKKP